MEYNKEEKKFEIEFWRILIICLALIILCSSIFLLMYEVNRLNDELFYCENENELAYRELITPKPIPKEINFSNVTIITT